MENNSQNSPKIVKSYKKKKKKKKLKMRIKIKTLIEKVIK